MNKGLLGLAAALGSAVGLGQVCGGPDADPAVTPSVPAVRLSHGCVRPRVSAMQGRCAGYVVRMEEEARRLRVRRWCLGGAKILVGVALVVVLVGLAAPGSWCGCSSDPVTPEGHRSLLPEAHGPPDPW